MYKEREDDIIVKILLTLEGNDKMRLYNIYRVCCEAYDSINGLEIETLTERNNQYFKLKNWQDYQQKLYMLRKLSMFKDEVDSIFIAIHPY